MDKEVYIDLRALNRIRRAKGLSQEKLSNAADKHRIYIYECERQLKRWQRGERFTWPFKPARFSTLVRLANALDCEEEEILYQA